MEAQLRQEIFKLASLLNTRDKQLNELLQKHDKTIKKLA